MSKEEIKDDIINDINRLLSKDVKDTENINELFKGNSNDMANMSMPKMQLPQLNQQQQMQQQMQQQ